MTLEEELRFRRMCPYDAWRLLGCIEGNSSEREGEKDGYRISNK